MSNDNFKLEFKRRCFRFSISVIQLEDRLVNKKSLQIIFSQLLRSATSIGANVVEGGNSTSKREFVNYFQIALKSSSETLYWLALIKETDPVLKRVADPLIIECTELKKMLATIIINTKNNSKF
jgi:four helix bundle protein